MKAFKKLALVTAIAAAPFAQAELTSIDDAALSNMTGQAGISLEVDAQISIGAVVYTDTDGLGNGAGSIALNNIVLGGSNGTGGIVGNLDEIKIDIDVDADAGLVIHLGSVNAAGIVDGTDPLDFGLSVGSVAINNQATLASNIFIGGNLGPIDIVIANDSTIALTAFFQVTEGSMTVDVLGMGISNLTINDNSNAFLLNSFSPYDQTAELNDATTGVPAGNFGVAQNGAAVTPATQALDADSSGTVETSEWLASGADADSDGVVTFAEADAAFAGGSGAIIQAGVFATATAKAPGLTNMAFVAMDIATSDTSYISSGGVQTDITNALEITIQAMNMDIGMDVALGGEGIGHVAINDLNLSGTTVKIYGH